MEDPANNGADSIMHLPDDCLFMIFRQLDCSTDRESFGLTCNRWLKIQNRSRRSLQFQCSFTVLDRAALSNNNLVINANHLHRLLTRFQHLNHLSLSDCSELPDSGLNQLQLSGSKLYSLYLDCCFQITDNGLSMVARSCPFLEVISLYQCNISDIGLESLAHGCSALTHINLSRCILVTDNGISTLAKACSQLHAIKISCCKSVNGFGLQECSPTLTFIDAKLCSLVPEGVKAMLTRGGVEFLDVSGTSWKKLSDGILATIGVGFATRLKILNLKMCSVVGDDLVIAIAKGCPSLEEWNLALCHGVRISGWQCIATHCNNLEKLHVNRCRNLCDQGLAALRDGCRRLSVLYINRTGRSVPLELFRLYRSDVLIKDEVIMSIGPHWMDDYSRK